MKFAEPEWLYLLIIPLLLLPLLAAAGNRKRKSILSRLLGDMPAMGAAVHLSVVRRFWRLLLLAGAAVFLIIAAAKPYIYSQLLPFEPKGRDLLILCDVSRSMNSTDIAPSRLRHARFIMHQLAAKERGDRFGLAAFAGNAYLSCPLTSDPVTFKEYVDELTTETVPAGGTNLEKALRVAEKAFAGSESSNRAIILLTDGEEVQGNTLAAAAELKKKKIPVFAVGFGDPVNGAVIPVEEGKSALVRDSSGKIVTSKLNEKILSRLAQETGGIYVRTTVTDPGLSQLESAIDNLNRSGRSQSKRQIPVEEFPKALGMALAALVMFLLLSERGNLRKNILFLLIGFLVLGAGRPPLEKNAAAAQTPPAIAEPEDPEALYNQALKLQEAGDPRYRELYSKVLSRVPVNSPAAVRSFHNLGAGSHRECRKKLDDSRKQLAAQQLDQALQTLGEAEKIAASAEELYGRSVTAPPQLPLHISANLTRLDRDRKAIRELKKRIEDLKKQQQRTQNKTRQAQQKNQSPPTSDQQRKAQQNAIDQARRESEKLQQQAQKMEQKELADSARKAAEELQKASQAKADKKDRKAKEHLKNAAQALAGKEEGSSGKEKGPGKEEKQPAQKQPAPGEQREPQQKIDGKKSAAQLLELMGEEDKKLRDAMKQRRNMRRVKVEKDW